MKNKFCQSLFILFVLLLFTQVDVIAQCPMCRMSMESNLANGGTAGKGLNTGILYMLAMPYTLVLTLGILWYRNKIKSVDKSGDIS